MSLYDWDQNSSHLVIFNSIAVHGPSLAFEANPRPAIILSMTISICIQDYLLKADLCGEKTLATHAYK